MKEIKKILFIVTFVKEEKRGTSHMTQEEWNLTWVKKRKNQTTEKATQGKGAGFATELLV